MLLSACNWVVLAPSGDVAAQQRDILVISTGLMLLIIVPVIILTCIFAWRYRRANKSAPYDPDWDHSTQLELVIWAAPLLIIICLGAVTWIGTHLLDPYRPLDRIAVGQPVTEEHKPITVQVVSLDWKWLFFYPELGIATVNELAAPVDTPINFELTSATVMNAFYIPSLAGMIYTMAGMETKLHGVMNKEGVYDGMSSHYSGAGFSHMRFKFHGLNQQDFDAWVQKVKAEGTPLTRDSYMELEKPSEKVPPTYFSSYEPGLYEAILNMCVPQGSMCMSEMMHIDMAGGAGVESQENRERLDHDSRRIEAGHEAPAATFPASGRPAHSSEHQEGILPDKNSSDVNQPAPAGETQGDTMLHGTDHGSPAPAQLNQTQ